MIWTILHITEITLWIIISFSVFYVAFFAVISLFYEKEDRVAIHAQALYHRMGRFLILYPAYKEDRVIINAVEQFLLQKYPATHYTVAVISDHMQPETNEKLSKLPITLLTPAFEKSSKAKAMQYAMDEVGGDFDNVVILDADNVVRPDFLDQLNVLCSIYDAIQCHRCAKNANNDVAVLDGASEEINNTLFRKAHNRLGLSSALIGSGMCFSYELFKKNVFQLSTAGEDREMEALLLHQEVFIKYAPDIHVFDEKVSNQDNFQKQRMRWMTAQVQSLLSNLPKIPKAILHGKVNFIDKTIQQALIPRSILIVLLGGISVIMTILFPSWCEKWWILFGILALSLFIAIPAPLRVSSFTKVLAIPGAGFANAKECPSHGSQEHRLHPYRTYHMSERVHRSVMNIKVGMLFYILSLFLAFFSRKVFLDCLGAEFIGLTGMLMNIMSFLSVAELGIGTSIVYFLYKPLQEDNHIKINEVMSMLAYLYRCIGFIIGGIGVIVSLFFPWWFSHLSTGLPLVYFAFYSFLATSMSGYIFNYKQLLVSANQKQYLVNAYFQTIAIIQSLTQIFLAYYYRNLYLWVIAGLVFTIIGIIIFNYRIRQLYPWLQVSLKEGRRNLHQYPEVLKKTRQVFVQKIKDFILYKSDEILVGAFVSVVKVAFYGNYTIIINKFLYLVNILSDGLSAGVGNLLAEGNEKNIMKVYWEMTAARFFILGIIIFSLLMFLQPFIGCWLGKQYQMEEVIAYLLIFNLFIRLQPAAVYIFIGASGLYSDVWAAWAELIINLAITLLLAPIYGIIGILLGKIISFSLISFFWKPYYLFSKGFHKSVWEYWRGMTVYYVLFTIFAVLALWLKHMVIDIYVDSFGSLIVCSILTYIPLVCAFFVLLFQFTTGMKYFVARKPCIYKILQSITINTKA